MTTSVDLEKEFGDYVKRLSIPGDTSAYVLARMSFFMGCATAFDIFSKTREMDEEDAQRLFDRLGKQMEAVADEMVWRGKQV